MWDDLIELAAELLDLVVSFFEFKAGKKKKRTENFEESGDTEKQE